MGKVRLELLSWIADTLSVDGSSSETVLEVQSGENRTVRVILNELALKHPRFGQNVYDAKMRNLSERVLIFLNGRLLALENGLETKLKDGDTLTCLPNIEGG